MFTGIIVEESLNDKKILKKLKIVKTEVEAVSEEHKTPWITKWTMHSVEIADDKAETVAEELSKVLDSEHDWYADFKNDKTHYVIFRNKVFKVNRSKPEQYKQVIKYGVSLGIPDYQLDFSPDIIDWKR